MTHSLSAMTGHIAQLEFAKQFRDAATAFHQSEPRRAATSLAFHFLIGHTIELALKSTLTLEGLSDSDLRRIGHDLDKALKAFRETELSCVEHQFLEGTIDLLNPYYKAKELEYFVQAKGMRLPIATEALECVNTVIQKLDRHYRTVLRNAS